MEASIHVMPMDDMRPTRRSHESGRHITSLYRRTAIAAATAAGVAACLLLATACLSPPASAGVELASDHGAKKGGGSGIGSIENQLQGAQQMFDEAQPVPASSTPGGPVSGVPSRRVVSAGSRGRKVARNAAGGLGLGDMSQKEFMHKVDSAVTRKVRDRCGKFV